MKKVVVFDLGGTLMEYAGMPLSWLAYYPQGFAAVNQALSLGLPQEEIDRSVQVLKRYNPRYFPREEEIPPEKIFGDAICHWREKPPVEQVIPLFFQGMELTPRLYEDTVPALSALKQAGYSLACLTNLPSGMPDALFREGIQDLTEKLDYYLSSELCGFRKPHPAGLGQIARAFGVPVETLLFVGDEELDGKTAQNAGCRFVRIVRDGAASRQGEGVIANLEELVDQAPLLTSSD